MDILFKFFSESETSDSLGLRVFLFKVGKNMEITDIEL